MIICLIHLTIVTLAPNGVKQMIPKKDRLFLSYTKREWILIERAIEISGKRNGVISFIIEETKKLDIDCSDLLDKKNNLTCVEKRQFYPPPSSAKILNDLSQRLGIPPSTIVSRLIINPLLKS